MKKFIKIIFCFLTMLQTAHAKTFVVTGATAGLGLETAKTLASQGHSLILISRDNKKLSLIKDEIQKDYHVKIDYISHNYNDLKMINLKRALLEDIKIDGLVIVTPRPKLDDSLLPSADSWMNMVAECFVGPLEVLKTVLPKMGNQGKVVVVSGITSKQLLPNHASYGVVRSMWLSEAKGLSHQLGPKGISVNTVSPGGTLTGSFLEKLDNRAKNNERTREEQIEVETSNIPLKKYGKPEDVANLISFLLSDGANHISGSNIVIDGGFTTSY